jgi:hypothetical protein
MEEDKKAYLQKRKQLDAKRRQHKVERTRTDQEVRREQREQRYDLSTVQRTVANMGLQTERAYDSEIRYNQEMLRLEQRMRESAQRHAGKVRRQEEAAREKIQEETRRLNHVLAENRKHNAEKYAAASSVAQFDRMRSNAEPSESS